MHMAQRISPVALEALKDALSKIYWYKSELQSFIRNSVGDPTIVQVADWSGYKIQAVSDIVDFLAADQDRHLGSLRRLVYDVVKFNSFEKLERLEDGKQKAERARLAVQSLKRLVEDHDEEVRKKEETEKLRKQEAERLNRSKAVLSRLEETKRRYTSLVLSTDPQGRGVELEKVMYDIFEIFDLDPKASFRLKGEQIDGAFSLDNTDYIFEAKWQQEPVSREQLDGFGGKVQRKLENTLGLFLSINGFSRDGVDIHSSGKPQFVLASGADLMAVLEARIDFVELLRRKKRHASQTGRILFEIHEF
jgi:predicted transcriptional regulator